MVFLVALAALVGVFGMVALFLVAIFNKLVRLENQFKNAFAQIDVQLKRRYDLIPNLVETAKGYLKHERETLEAVIAARNQAQAASNSLAGDASNADGMKKLLNAEAALGGVMGKFFALSERYPDLQANQTMEQLMEELRSTENRIGFARQAYNDSVMSFNTAIEMFPNSIVAGFKGCRHASLWEIENVLERENIKVSF